MVKTIITEKGVISTPGSGVEIHGKVTFDDRWDDLHGTIHDGTGPTSLPYEAYRDTGFFMRFFRHNKADTISMMYQMPHEWNGTAIRPHIHCIPMSAGSGDVVLDYAFTWSHVNGALSGSIGWSSSSMTRTFAASDQYRHLIINLGLQTPLPENSHDSSIFIIRVKRNVASDTYQTAKDHGTPAANVAIISFDLHYRKGKGGSTTELPEVEL